ncbi:Hypothetical predicted protein [Olea europaea subsp. europaea]|uniref:Uncharacterized protein n=1 Tax=Olea europaea subsp. europaea TaxID=158383 RepID=A0A8S0RXV0_OLEEU|nr:Hypothetical predicted protein [Olea europaea subsp. europaea]
MMGCCLQKKEKWKIDMNACHPHLLDLAREQLIGSSPEEKNENKFREQLVQSSPGDKNKEKYGKCYSYRSVMELRSTGIHFRSSQTNHVTDVKFKSHLIYGTLTFPPLVVDDSTKSLLLDLAVYEMCPHCPSDCHIMSYTSLMDSFIDHADDVKELRKRGILVNALGNDCELAKLFNKISNELVPDFCGYEDVQRQIENHYKSQAHVWMAEWIHTHFRSPWAFLAFLALGELEVDKNGIFWFDIDVKSDNSVVFETLDSLRMTWNVFMKGFERVFTTMDCRGKGNFVLGLKVVFEGTVVVGGVA